MNFPVNRTLLWDAPDPPAVPTSYEVKQNGAVIGTPTVTSLPVSFPTTGHYDLTVTPQNAFELGVPTTLSLDVNPAGKVKNLHLA